MSSMPNFLDKWYNIAKNKEVRYFICIYLINSIESSIKSEKNLRKSSFSHEIGSPLPDN